MSERRPHPAMSDIALELARKQPSAPVSHVSVERLKDYTKVGLDIAHSDPFEAFNTAKKLMKLADAEWPRDNGDAS
jgi:hypothetical protein